MDTKVYSGRRDAADPSTAGGCTVTVDGRTLTLARSLKVRNHSPAGFNWGYAGSGPAQLALAILLDYLDDEELAQRYYQDFKFTYVARWPADNGWVLTGHEIDSFVASKLAEAR